MTGFEPPIFECADCPELRGESRAYPVAIIGAGPVGLVAAVDLAMKGVPVVVLDDKNTLSDGSRAICWAKRTLEICDRLGLGDRLVDKGVTWNTGKVYLGDEEIYEFDLLPEPDHKRPAFINLQQYYFEHTMIERAAELPEVEIRWQHQATDIRPGADGVRVSVTTPRGDYALDADWLIAADGVRSTARRVLGFDFEGRIFRDRFLITDIRMKADLPAIRRFWFNPTFHDGQSTLLHKQADDVWRVDFQLDWDADPEHEKDPRRVKRRLRRMLGEVDFEILWTSVYTFTCRRIDHFRHGRVLFAGDSAHVISPFGARGGNGGIQDADNLVWKLALVLEGRAPEGLLDSYDHERTRAADENNLNSTRSTDFMTPKTRVSRAFRDAVLDLAREHAFARRLVNSGRLSTPATYRDSPLSTPDVDDFAGDLVPGAPCADAPVTTGERREGWLLDHLGGGFVLLRFAGDTSSAEARRQLAGHDGPEPPVRVLSIGQDLEEVRGVMGSRYDARDGTCYLIRPDQHIAARWRRFDPNAVRQALDRAVGRHP
ncbi:MAG: FAD-dependent oxidoreductase [Alphaproteobacteria bacterium]